MRKKGVQNVRGMIQKKYGRQNGKQQYFCMYCGKKFQLRRWKKSQEKEDISFENIQRKQTQKQIGERLEEVGKWVNQYLRKEKFSSENYNTPVTPCEIILVVDTTYFEQFNSYGV